MIGLFLAAALASPNECLPCHAEEVMEWGQSRHAMSATNANFQASVGRAQFRGWCMGCHLPTPDGVSCAVCHTTPHEPEPALHTVALCGSCHQFTLPAFHPMATEVAVQNTVREWEEHGGGTSCQHCHFRDTHQLPGAHDRAFVRAAISVNTEVVDNRLKVRIGAHQVGHTIPTGDPFRRLEFQVCRTPSCEVVLHRTVLMRLFHGPTWGVHTDTTLSPKSPTHLSLDLVASAQWWRLVYHLAEDALVDTLPPEEVGFTVHSGPIERQESTPAPRSHPR